MKYVTRLFATLLFIFIIIVSTRVNAFAMNTGFTTEEASEQTINNIINKTPISILTEEPAKKTIDHFDVNQYGMIAIVQSVPDIKTICVYTKSGEFKYAYRFKCDGSVGVEWDENTLMIYLVRESVAFTVNSNGEIEHIVGIANTIENNSYWNHSVFANKRVIDNTEYRLNNDRGIFNLFASSYTQLVVTENNGEESIIYDVNSSQIVKDIATFILIVILIFIAIYYIRKEFIKLKQ